MKYFAIILIFVLLSLSTFAGTSVSLSKPISINPTPLIFTTSVINAKILQKYDAVKNNYTDLLCNPNKCMFNISNIPQEFNRDKMSDEECIKHRNELLISFKDDYAKKLGADASFKVIDKGNIFIVDTSNSGVKKIVTNVSKLKPAVTIKGNSTIKTNTTIKVNTTVKTNITINVNTTLTNQTQKINFSEPTIPEPVYTTATSTFVSTCDWKEGDLRYYPINKTIYYSEIKNAPTGFSAYNTTTVDIKESSGKYTDLLSINIQNRSNIECILYLDSTNLSQLYTLKVSIANSTNYRIMSEFYSGNNLKICSSFNATMNCLGEATSMVNIPYKIWATANSGSFKIEYKTNNATSDINIRSGSWCRSILS